MSSVHSPLSQVYAGRYPPAGSRPVPAAARTARSSHRTRRYPVQALAEQVVDPPCARLRWRSRALAIRRPGEAQVGLHHVVVQPDPDVADEAVLSPVLDGVLEPARLPGITDREFSYQPGGRIRGHRRHPALIPGDRRIRAVGRQNRGIVRAEAAQDEPGGFQQHDPSR